MYEIGVIILFQYLDEHPPLESNSLEAKTGLHDAKMDLLRATGDEAKKLGKKNKKVSFGKKV